MNDNICKIFMSLGIDGVNLKNTNIGVRKKQKQRVLKENPLMSEE